jgi:hypothetical protein
MWLEGFGYSIKHGLSFEEDLNAALQYESWLKAAIQETRWDKVATNTLVYLNWNSIKLKNYYHCYYLQKPNF